MVVELLRDQPRQYTPDTSQAIRTRNTAAIFGDIAQTTGAVSQAAKGVVQIREDLSKNDVAAAKEAARQAQTDLALQNAKHISDHGKPMSQADFEKAAEETYKKFRPDIKWSEGFTAYDKSNREFVSNVIATNARYIDESKNKQALDKADTTMLGLRERVKAYSREGNTTAIESLVSEGVEQIIKKMGDGVVGEEQRQEIRAAVGSFLYEDANTELAMSGAAGSEIVLGRLSNNERFLEEAPSAYKDNFLAVKGARELARLKAEHQALKDRTALMNPKSADFKDAAAAGKKLSDKIRDFESQGEGYKKWKEDVVTAERLDQLARMTPTMRRDAGERMQQQMQQANKAMKTSMSEFVRFNSPRGLDAVAQMAGKGKYDNMTRIDPATGMALTEQQMSYVDNIKPKEFWEGLYDNMKTYETEMSRVSPLMVSAPADKAQVNYEFEKLITRSATDEYGSPLDFQEAAISFLSRMAAAPLTESERRAYQDTVGSLMLADDAQLREVEDLLMSGDVAVYEPGGMRKQALGAGLEPMSAGLRDGQVFVDARPTKARMPGMGGQQEFKSTGGLGDVMRTTQAEYQTRAVQMMRDNRSFDEIRQMKRELFNDNINKWYGSRYVVDLRELDRKIANKEPAFQELDGIIYEYRGRDSVGRPVWKDNAILNTNRDFARINKSYRITEFGSDKE